MIPANILETARDLRNLERAAEYLTAQGFLTFGIETVACGERSAAYVNLGETYETTICREGGEYSAQSWGDWLETAEREHCEATDETRCGYCGEFTPLCAAALAEPAGARHSWRETVCQNCGRNVSTGEKPAQQPAGDDETAGE